MALPLIYNWRNLFVRKSSTLLTFGVMAAIVSVLIYALAFGEGMRSSLEAGGADDLLIVIKPGATGESTSIVTREEAAKLTQLEGLTVNPQGEVILSRELCTQVSLPRRGSPPGNMVPVAVRGIEPIGFEAHSNVRVVEGRTFDSVQREIIVGKAVQRRADGLGLGEQLTLGYLGNQIYTVVGVFEAEGGPLESEIWGPLRPLQSAFGREEVLSSVALRIDAPDQAPRLAEAIRGPAFKLNAKTERTYYQDIADKSSQIVNLTLILVGFMAFGACFAVANTIYAAVDARTQEIAMLRTIGFSGGTIVLAFLLEAMLICGIASAGGALFATLRWDGHEEDFMAEATWSTFAYRMDITPKILAISLGSALLVALIGAIVPAVRASRISILAALRQA